MWILCKLKKKQKYRGKSKYHLKSHQLKVIISILTNMLSFFLCIHTHKAFNILFYVMVSYHMQSITCFFLLDNIFWTFSPCK